MGILALRQKAPAFYTWLLAKQLWIQRCGFLSVVVTHSTLAQLSSVESLHIYAPLLKKVSNDLLESYFVFKSNITSITSDQVVK